MSSDTAKLVAVARGASPADLLLINASIINVFNGLIEKGSVAICGNRIAGIGDYSLSRETIDLKGKFLAPGLLNGHTHLESSLLDIGEYARAVVPRGTTAIITDLHEIANVSGMRGISYILENSRELPLDIFLMAPSCVPATHLENSGANIGVEEIRQLLTWKNCIGLGEVMNYPGLMQGEPTILEKIGLAFGKIIDGHAPGLRGKELNAYVSAGIMSDHESVTIDEAAEKLNLGMQLMIREGSSEKNLEALLPLVNDRTYRKCSFVVDDRSCVDLLRDGDINAVVRKAIRLGMEPVRAIQLATINTATYFKISRMGGIAPGYLADLIVINNLEELDIEMVLYRGKTVAKDGKPLFEVQPGHDAAILNTIHIPNLKIEDLVLECRGDSYPIIELVPGQIVTRKLVQKVKTENGRIIPDIPGDILKLVVVERHKATGNIGRGLVKGFGLKRGAMASSVSHDSHNIIAVGTSDEDILEAIKTIERMQGGLVIISDGKELSSLSLPVAGLLSREPLETVVSRLESMEKTARQLGSNHPAPFSILSFLALPVIPELRLTDLGLVDVNEFKLIT